MKQPAKPPAAVQRLAGLADQPAEQMQYALEVLDRERGIRVVPAALAVVAAAPPPAAGPVLARLYAYYAADGVKRDPGCHLRLPILEALRPVAAATDAAIAAGAVATYEFLPPTHTESAAGLRGAGLLLLADLDPGAAVYAAVRLLVDPHTSRLSGDPATTAARLLADQGQILPLYFYLVDSRERLAEVTAACLKGLAGAPLPVLDGVLDTFGATEDDLVLAGLFDLVLEAPAWPAGRAFAATFLRTTRRYPAYRYLVTAIVAGRDAEMRATLLAAAEVEQDRRKLEILLPALDLLPPAPAVAALTAALRARL